MLSFFYFNGKQYVIYCFGDFFIIIEAINTTAVKLVNIPAEINILSKLVVK